MSSDITPIGFNLDYNELQQFQDVYAQATRLFIFCMANDGQGISRVTDISGDPTEVDRLLALLVPEQITSLVVRVLSSTLEEQVIEDTEYSNLKVATISVKIAGKPAFCWFVCGVFDDDGAENAIMNFHTTVSESNFLKSVDLLRTVSNRMYGNLYDGYLNKSAAATPVADESAISATASDMGRRYKYMTEIVSLLDSDDSFDDVAKKAIVSAAEYSNISNAYLLKLVSEDEVDVLVDYSKADAYSLENGFRKIPMETLHSLGDRPTVVTSGTVIDPVSRYWLDSMGITALIALPIVQNHKPIMYTFFADTTPDKKFDIDDTKFFGETVRIIL